MPSKQLVLSYPQLGLGVMQAMAGLLAGSAGETGESGKQSGWVWLLNPLPGTQAHRRFGGCREGTWLEGAAQFPCQGRVSPPVAACLRRRWGAGQLWIGAAKKGAVVWGLQAPGSSGDFQQMQGSPEACAPQG